jgi:anti-sigma factor ChrR (cupin superfamily)
MRTIILPLAALALVAGCKGKAPEATATDAAATATTAAATEMPALPENAKATAAASVPGSYANAGAVLVLGADDSATMTDAAGKVTKGKWAWYSDGRRILLTTDKSVWAVADGALYKMADKDAPLSGFTTDQIWAKAK